MDCYSTCDTEIVASNELTGPVQMLKKRTVTIGSTCCADGHLQSFRSLPLWPSPRVLQLTSPLGLATSIWREKVCRFGCAMCTFFEESSFRLIVLTLCFIRPTATDAKSLQVTRIGEFKICTMKHRHLKDSRLKAGLSICYTFNNLRDFMM